MSGREDSHNWQAALLLVQGSGSHGNRANVRHLGWCQAGTAGEKYFLGGRNHRTLLAPSYFIAFS